ncbi:hypothetical protein LBMAG13_11400 [Actinomycetes bacterium]|nr:hypothetical protein LBMAG13_11400 [Actinomycetes bacterium]
MSNLVQIVAPLFRIDRRMSFWVTLATIVMGVALQTANALKWGQQWHKYQ